MTVSYMKQAHAILRDAEVGLCRLIPKALAGHRDDEAERLMGLARVLADARTSSTRSGRPGSSFPSRADTSRRTRVAPKQSTSRKTVSPYPKFLREGDALLKLGWSRRSRSEYEHRASHAAVIAVAARVAETASTRSRFTVDDLGDVRITRGEVPISSCQIYLCIAWFRRAGLVVQHGRRGYSLPVSPARLPARVNSAWGQLPKR